MSFYEGRKIEVHTNCKECGEDIVWYNIFKINVNNLTHNNVHIIPMGNEVSRAKVEIVEEREKEIDVSVNFYCNLCNKINEFTGTIYKDKGKIKFRS